VREILYCECPCHLEPPLISDVIAALSACQRCYNAHEANERRQRERIEPTVYDEGANPPDGSQPDGN
jgi:alkylhydroperoxidase family enzyme